MSTAFKTPRDYDPTSTAEVITGESHTIPASAPFQVSLKYIPRHESPSTVSIAGFTEVSGTPAVGQFRVNYTTATPEGETVPGVTIDFHSSDAGTSISVDYHSCGSIWQSSDVSAIQSVINSLEDSLQGGGASRRAHIFAAVLRYDATAGGWRLLYTLDGTHVPIAVSGVTSDDTAITINLDQTGWGSSPAACTWLVVPDETLVKKGVFCGASFDESGGSYYGTINLYRGPIGDYIHYDTGTSAWVSTESFYTMSWVTDHLLLTRAAEAKLGDGLFPSLTPRQTPYQVTLGGVGHGSSFGVADGADGVEVYFYDASGTLVTSPDANMKFFITDPRALLPIKPNTDFASYEDLSEANLWIIGIATTAD